MTGPARKRAASSSSTEERSVAGKRQRIPQTCDWILREPAYSSWKNWDEATPPTLWIRGPAGTGKSCLAEFIAGSLAREDDNASATVSCFADAVSTPAAMLLDVLNQLQQSPTVGNEAKSIITETSRSIPVSENIAPVDPSFKLWDGLMSVIAQTPRMRLIVDGVDEMPGTYLIPQESSFVSRLVHLANTTPGHVRVVVLSRPNSNIETALEGCPVISITPEKVEDDLRKFTDAEISKHPILAAAKDKLVPLVVDRADGLFLKASLSIQCLAPLKSTEAVFEQAGRLETSLDSLYQVYLKSHPLDPLQTLLRDIILRWLVLSVKPMRVVEIANLVAIETAAFIPDMASRAMELCGPLVKLEGELLKPAHHTLREFLVKKDADETPESLWRYSERDMHMKAALNLLAYLCQPQFSDATAVYSPLGLKETYPLVEYATLYWPHHALLSTPSDELLERIRSFIESPQGQEWQLILFPKHFQNSVLQIPPRTYTNGLFFTLFMQKSKLVNLFPQEARDAVNQALTDRMRSIQEIALEKARKESHAHGDGQDVCQRLLELAETYSWIKEYQAQTTDLLREAHKLCSSKENHRKENSLTFAISLSLADAMKRDGKYQEAKEILEEAITLAKSTNLEECSQMFAYDTLGWVSMRLDKLDEAAAYLEQAFNIAERNFGRLSPLTMRSQVTLADVLGKLGRTEEASVLCASLERQLEQHYERGIELPKDSISQLNTLASIYMLRENFEGAVRVYRVVVEDRQKIFGSSSRLTLWAEMQLGFALDKAGEKDSMKKLFRDLLPRQMDVLGPNHQDVKDVQAMLE